MKGSTKGERKKEKERSRRKRERGGGEKRGDTGKRGNRTRRVMMSDECDEVKGDIDERPDFRAPERKGETTPGIPQK